MGYNYNCEPEVKIYNFLKQVKSENEELYEPVKRLLGYLYKTVKKDCFQHKRFDLNNGNQSNKESYLASCEKDVFDYYVESDDGILNGLISIVKNNPESFKYFYQEVEYFLEMAENGLYSDYGIYRYIFNLYTMLSFYRINPNDLDGFKAIVDDLSSFFITNGFSMFEEIVIGLGSQRDSENIESKKEIINLLLSIPNYQNKQKIRRELKIFLNELIVGYDYEDQILYKEIIKELISFYKEIDMLESKEVEIIPGVIDSIEEEIMKNIKYFEAYGYLYATEKIKKNNTLVVYAPILLRGKRFDFFKNILIEREDNEDIQKEILNYVKQMDADFFEYLNNLNNEEDSFVKYMSIIFDSDTYYEVDSKLNDLKEASIIYKEDEERAFNLLLELNSVKHKEVIDGIVMDLQDETSISKIEKPEKIIDRMIILHKALEYAPDEYFYINRGSDGGSKLTLKSFSEKMNKQREKNKVANTMINILLETATDVKTNLESTKEKQKTKSIGSFFTKKKNN